MKVQMTPPDIDALSRALRPIATAGLPVSTDLDDETLLGLRGVVARSIDPTDRFGRIKALDDLLQRFLVFYPDDELGEPARILFGMASGTRGRTLTDRRQQAARQANYEADHFRKHIEPKIIKQLAWQLHRDSQNYIPRTRPAEVPVEASGDTPFIREGDISDKDAAEREELLSRLWANVYTLRAEILRVERLKVWPHDVTEPKLSEQKLDEALAARDAAVKTTKVSIQRYLDRYGQYIQHGEADYSVEGLLRLAGWMDDY